MAESSVMKTLLTNYETIYNAAKTAGTLEVNTVERGLHDDPSQIPTKTMPYLVIDEDGERVEDREGTEEQVRLYRIIIEVGAYSMKDKTTALDKCLDISAQAKSIMELEANRQLDGHNWGIEIVPFEWNNQDKKYFFRGRRILVEIENLESKPYLSY
jgi:hypothetical protein